MTNQMTGTIIFNHTNKQVMHTETNDDDSDNIAIGYHETLMVENGIEVTPVVRVIPNFSEKLKNNEEYYLFSF